MLRTRHYNYRTRLVLPLPTKLLDEKTNNTADANDASDYQAEPTGVSILVDGAGTSGAFALVIVSTTLVRGMIAVGSGIIRKAVRVPYQKGLTRISSLGNTKE